MDIFNYNPISNEYISTEVADLDPLAGEPLIPAHATSVPVISVTAGFVPVFNGVSWDATEDNRGTVYYTDTTLSTEYTELGALPAGITKLVPPAFAGWDGNGWIEDLELVRAKQKNTIYHAFNSALSGGFVTTSTIKMDATYDDVMRLDAGVRLAEALAQANIDIRTFENNTQTVLTTDAKTMVNEVGTNYQTKLQQKWTLSDQIDAAATKVNIESIVWT